MKSKKNIVFLGMMGSGKSSIGKLISKKLKLDFFDIDENIEKNLKMKISKIFNEKGENFFRKYEEKLTLDILKKDIEQLQKLLTSDIVKDLDITLEEIKDLMAAQAAKSE